VRDAQALPPDDSSQAVLQDARLVARPLDDSVPERVELPADLPELVLLVGRVALRSPADRRVAEHLLADVRCLELQVLQAVQLLRQDAPQPAAPASPLHCGLAVVPDALPALAAVWQTAPAAEAEFSSQLQRGLQSLEAARSRDRRLRPSIREHSPEWAPPRLGRRSAQMQFHAHSSRQQP
jgi:hypothetical protein